MTDIKTKEAQDNLAFLQNADKPTLENLSYALRHPETWPEGFIWNYADCDNCAMGLARKLWNTPGTNKQTGATIMARTFAMPYEEAKSIFMGLAPDGSGADWLPHIEKKEIEGHLWWKKLKTTSSCDLTNVTPEMVADQIDEFIAENK